MKTDSTILIAEDKDLIRFDTSKSEILWSRKFDKKIKGMTRINDHVFVTLSSTWTGWTSLINFKNGEVLWTIKKYFYNILINDKSIYFIDKWGKFNWTSLSNGKEKHRGALPFLWTTPKLSLISNKLYLFTKKKTFVFNESTKNFDKTKLPFSLNASKITSILDEFQINVNSLSNSNDSAIIYAGDSGANYGDSGVVGMDGGGGAGGGE
tara:strand:- start:650 stop:1276 length:627 start_codon:yes stop_codon:yes gene_type:complete